MFAYGEAAGSNFTNVSNKVSFTGVVASDTTGVGTGRSAVSASNYGGDKGIVAYGSISNGNITAISNLISNTGTVAADVTGVGTAREGLSAAGFSTSA